MVSPPAGGLFADSAQPGRSPARAVSRPRVLKTSSGLLYDALAGVYASLGFDVVDDEVFRDLVIARVVEPTSLLDVDRVLAEMGRAQRACRRANAPCAVRRRQAVPTATRSRPPASPTPPTHGDVSLVLYDVTTLYFEAEKEDDLRKVGYSKERRVDPQIVVGLLVDRRGFPLEIGCYEGNKAETLTIVPIVKQFQDRHDLADMVVVADAGMLSATNLKDLDDAGLRFIVGSRVDQGTQGSGVPLPLARRRVHRRPGHRHHHPTPRRQDQRREQPEDQGRTGLGPRRASRIVAGGLGLLHQTGGARQQDPHPAGEPRQAPSSPARRPPRTPRFVKNTSGGHVLDETSLARARRLVGLKGYVTNIAATLMPAGEVIASYHDLWHVEQSFRMSKTDLRARPMFARTRDAIEAHLTIVFTALAVSREVQNRTGLSLRRVLRTLRPLRSATVEINGITTTIPPALSPDEKAILNALQTPTARH